MISPTLDSVRIALHLLGVAVWTGGQIVLAGVVPAVRSHSREATVAIARGFARLAWPSMLLIVFTGVWAFADIDPADRGGDYAATFGLKMLLVAVTVASAVIHSQGTSKIAKAVGGAAGLVSALVAAYLGVLMAHVGW